MTKKKFPVHYANFVCHFGEAELLDQLDEIVIPAFQQEGKRTFKDGSYFFNSVAIINLGKNSNHPELAICGRFIKDMVVRSEQRYDARTNSVVPDNRKLETAPSAIFLLLLASHKLVYLSETANAPGLESFRSTVSSFFEKERQTHIDDVYERAKKDALSDEEKARFEVNSNSTDEEPSEGDDGSGRPQKRLTKKKLNEIFPRAELEIVALSNDESLRNFVSRFKTLESATLRLVKPNSELDNDDFLAAVRGKANSVGSKTSSLVYKNPDGLIKTKVVEQLEAAASEGNTEIKLDGKDKAGQTLRGSNDEFKVVSFLLSKPSELFATARAMFALYKGLRTDGIIKVKDHALSKAAQDRLLGLAHQTLGVTDDGT